MAAHQAPPSLIFSRQEHWSGLPFPSPMHESEKWKWSCSVMSDPKWPHGLQPTRLLHPWDFPARVPEWVAIAFSPFVYEWMPNYCWWEENINEGHLAWLPCRCLEPSFLILLAVSFFDTAAYTSFWFNVCRGYCWLKLGPHILLGYLCLGPIILFLVWKIIPPPTVEAKRNLFPSKEVSGDAVSLA